VQVLGSRVIAPLYSKTWQLMVLNRFYLVFPSNMQAGRVGSLINLHSRGSLACSTIFQCAVSGQYSPVAGMDSIFSDVFEI